MRLVPIGSFALLTACFVSLGGASVWRSAPGPAASRASLQTGIPATSAVRIALAARRSDVVLPERGAWRLEDAWRRVHARGSDPFPWRIERRNRRLRAVTVDGMRATAWTDEPFVLRADTAGTAGGTAPLMWQGRPFRGELEFVAVDTAILVVNTLPLDDYLRGVVAIEIGTRGPNEFAAIEAQAVAARSYTVVRIREARQRPYDLTGAPADQLYGGMLAEEAMSDSAVRLTSGLVLTWNGEVVRAPYHSTCGGSTAAPLEVWKGGDEPYLRGVSDRIPGTDRAWCDISPRFHWERTFDRHALNEALARYIASHVEERDHLRGVGSGVRNIRIVGSTTSGRVRGVDVDTDDGIVRIEGNDMRFAFREIGGKILNSTYFSLEPVIGRDGRLTQLTIRGTGNGHGVGMCQWGAIGRARAGQSLRDILTAYFPGTTVTRLS